MARDLLIHGIHKKEFITSLQMNFQEWSLPEKDLSAFLMRFKNDILISDLMALEEYLFREKQLINAEQHQFFKFETIVDFRSKPIGFATAQLVHYYMDELYFGLTKKAAIASKNGCFIFSKAQIVGLLDWLITVSYQLRREADNELAKGANRSLKIEAQKLMQTGMCKGEEFEYYGDQFFRFTSWKKKVGKTHFDCYYWEDSF